MGVKAPRIQKHGYDSVAAVYDPLARFFLGRSMNRARASFLTRFRPGARILILGGGTGDLLPELLAAVPTVRVDFVEPSQAMLRRARRRAGTGAAGVTFVRGDHSCIPGSGYDVVCTNFLLDGLCKQEAEQVMEEVKGRLQPNGTWLITDFHASRRLSHRLLTITMYCFFRGVAGIRATALPDYDVLFARHGLCMERENCFMGGFIRARLYRRPEVQKAIIQ